MVKNVYLFHLIISRKKEFGKWMEKGMVKIFLSEEIGERSSELGMCKEKELWGLFGGRFCCRVWLRNRFVPKTSQIALSTTISISD